MRGHDLVSRSRWLSLLVRLEIASRPEKEAKKNAATVLSRCSERLLTQKSTRSRKPGYIPADVKASFSPRYLARILASSAISLFDSSTLKTDRARAYRRILVAFEEVFSRICRKFIVGTR